MLSTAHRSLLVLVAFFCVALGSLGVAVAVTGGTGKCPVRADAFGVSHQEARDRAATPGNEGHTLPDHKPAGVATSRRTAASSAAMR